MLSGQLFQLFIGVDCSEGRRTLCRVQLDIVRGPFGDEFGVHGERRGKPLKLAMGVADSLNTYAGETRNGGTAALVGVKC
jgi:hypothetical protein